MLGENLKKLRGKKTQDDIAKILGISRARYSHYENNIREPDCETLIKLADLYSVTLDYLLGRSHTEKELKYIDENVKTFINDPSLEKWYQNLPNAAEQDLQKLRKIWDILQEGS